MASVMVTKVERKSRMTPWLNPKEYIPSEGVFSSESPKDNENYYGERSTPGRRVEPQAYGGRKIQLLYENIGCRYDLHSMVIIETVYTVHI